MLTSTARQTRRTNWALTGIEVGVLLFAAGMVVLYINPFWHPDDGGLQDWRLHWWNATGEILAAIGLLTGALALVGIVALIASRCFGRRSWPYLAAALLVGCAVVWASSAGFVRNLDTHFEWNAVDGFDVFRVQVRDDSAGAWRPAGSPLWQSIIEAQIHPLLRGYFKLNDWQKMNGDIEVKVVRIIPITWPVALGSGGETLEDPDETALMRAAAQEDFKAVQRLLATAIRTDVNALDQGGQTALILACQNPKASPDVVKALLAAGADLNLRSRNGYTALTWALARNNGEVTRLLRRAGARP
jgi:hypothetical protein